jgi:hypothetical protein
MEKEQEKQNPLISIMKNKQKRQRRLIPIKADLEPAFGEKLKIVCEKNKETKADFMRRAIENELAIIEGKHENIKIKPQTILEAKVENLSSILYRMEAQLHGIKDEMNLMRKQSVTNTKTIIKKVEYAIGVAMMGLKATYKVFHYFLRLLADNFNLSNEELRRRADEVNTLAHDSFGVKIYNIKTRLEESLSSITDYILEEK